MWNRTRERFATGWRRLPRAIRQALVAIPATVLVITGAVMLVLPGPGLLVIGAGLTLFAAEFHWARRITTDVRVRYARFRRGRRASVESGDAPDSRATNEDPATV